MGRSKVTRIMKDRPKDLYVLTTFQTKKGSEIDTKSFEYQELVYLVKSANNGVVEKYNPNTKCLCCNSAKTRRFYLITYGENTPGSEKFWKNVMNVDPNYLKCAELFQGNRKKSELSYFCRDCLIANKISCKKQIRCKNCLSLYHRCKAEIYCKSCIAKNEESDKVIEKLQKYINTLVNEEEFLSIKMKIENILENIKSKSKNFVISL